MTFDLCGRSCRTLRLIMSICNYKTCAYSSAMSRPSSATIFFRSLQDPCAKFPKVNETFAGANPKKGFHHRREYRNKQDSCVCTGFARASLSASWLASSVLLP